MHIRKLAAAASLAIIFTGPAHADHNWFTLAGDPADPSADYIQFDPSELSREDGVVTIPVRVSRAHPRTSTDGIVFRSFTGVAAIDCTQRSARFLRSSFYAEPHFRGQPFITREFGPLIRPMAFRGIDGDRAQQVIRAACKGEPEVPGSKP